MTDPKSIELEIPGLTIRGLSWGDDDRPTIVGFHGWLDNSATFSALAPVLTQRGFRVIAVDLPGHGRSDHRSPDAHYHYINYGIDAVSIIDALGLERVHLMGHSMGAGVSLLAAPALGERVERLSLIEGMGPFTTPGPETAETFVVAAEAHRRVRRRERGVYPSWEAAVKRKAEAIGVSPEIAEVLVKRSAVEVEGGYQFGDDPRLVGRSFIRLTESQFHSFLAAVEVPVRLVIAKDGLSYPEEAMQARLAAIPDVTWVKLDGGHHLHLEDPNAVAEALEI